ncbi:hypothetical protein JW835_04120 [bacterium]|nr:hypothetical protein [bacterium]RQV97982.1 MAG: hypothetical protein EH221_03220 [bacterium]
MITYITKELKKHAPFTSFGAIIGILIIIVSFKIPEQISYNIFYILHPVHVVLSALVTASIYRLHSCDRFGEKCIKGKCNLWALLMIGYFGSVGIATLSDSIIPYLGEILLDLPNRGIHLGFIEKWWLVNPLAIIGVLFACFKPATKVPHAGHVLLSTWASLFHILMAMGGALPWYSYVAVFLFLFLAVWAPCCLSDIVFPLLFVKQNSQRKNK